MKRIRKTTYHLPDSLPAFEDDHEPLERAIRSIPVHYSAHRQQLDSSLAPWMFPDPGIGNTSAGGGILAGFNEIANFNLIESNASAAEIRTLPDPVKPGLTLTLTLTKTAGQNLVVRCNTPLWLSTTALLYTQNGNYITFTTAGHTVQLFSVPIVPGSFTSVHSSPVTNSTGARWCAVFSDGPTVN